VIDIRLVSNSSHLRKDLAAFLESNAVLRQLFSLDTGNFDEIPPEAVVVIVLDLVHREDYSDALLFSLQSLPPDRRVPAIAIVAEGTPSTEIARIIESGANDCVQLPLCHQELLARVKIHGGYMEYIRQQERVLEKNRQASSLAPAAPNAADLRLLEDEIAALKAENRELADKVDNALQDKAALEAIINTIAEHGSIVENQMDNELQAAKYQAGHDPLTQLYNRLSFNSFVQQDLEKVSTTNAPLSLIMFDIDHFKQLRSRHGGRCPQGTVPDGSKDRASIRYTMPVRRRGVPCGHARHHRRGCHEPRGKAAVCCPGDKAALRRGKDHGQLQHQRGGCPDDQGRGRRKNHIPG